MVRAAAKNHGNEAGGVGIVTDPADYAGIVAELKANGGALSYKTRFDLARKAFTHTARYDAAISNHLTALADDGSKMAYPERFQLAFDKVQDLRYGENPHQSAAFYRESSAPAGAIAAYTQVQGKELSYNNIADSDAAWECEGLRRRGLRDRQARQPLRRGRRRQPARSLQEGLLHRPHLGLRRHHRLQHHRRPRRCRSRQRPVPRSADRPRLHRRSPRAPQGQAERPRADRPLGTVKQPDYKRVGGGLLVQSADFAPITAADLKVVTKRAPTDKELSDLLFAWRVAKYVKSNAIVYCKDGMTIGVGAGQMSRVDSARIAKIKAENAGLVIPGCVVASDAFFPFRDGLDVLAQAGATAVIQPGGSMRDAEVIAAADEQGIAMVLTGFRHFRH
jgi:phosphoribosylaminoimidazolecarboxamide formyltransferase/IMP cyclohydrolase